MLLIRISQLVLGMSMRKIVDTVSIKENMKEIQNVHTTTIGYMLDCHQVEDVESRVRRKSLEYYRW